MNIAQLRSTIQPLRQTLLDHPLYKDLRTVTAPLDDPKIGLVTCLYRAAAESPCSINRAYKPGSSTLVAITGPHRLHSARIIQSGR